ncbi:hypothetical protein B0G80_8587 [Paraburkholderia sp. BL6669N2]|nr:hypothetical protein B0G80_8587 [Paraburkholderia sp. BL6669N2]
MTTAQRYTGTTRSIYMRGPRLDSIVNLDMTWRKTTSHITAVRNTR